MAHKFLVTGILAGFCPSRLASEGSSLHLLCGNIASVSIWSSISRQCH
jgi:hypothetical protein